MTARLSWAQVVDRRMSRHLLSAASPDGAAAVVAAMGGAHAQVMSAAELSIGLRSADLTRSGVRDALWGGRSLVKTYGLRGTVHLFPADELSWWMTALGQVPRRSGLPPDARMDEAQTDAVVAAVAAALAEGELTVDELTAEVVTRAGPWAGDLVMPAFNGWWPRWRQVVDVAAYRVALCFGPARGRLVTFAGPRRWLGGWTEVDPTAALGSVVRRYLHAYGPATPAYFARWLSAPKPWADDVFAAMGPALEPVEVDGAAMWVNAGDTEPVDPPGASVRLLPYFDPYAVGCHPRPLVFPGVAADRAMKRGQAGTSAVVLIDGTVGGVWHQKRSGRRLAVTVEVFGPLGVRRLRQLDEQVQRLEQVLEATASLTLGPVTVGQHL